MGVPLARAGQLRPVREQRVPRAAGRVAAVRADERAVVRVDRVRPRDAGGRDLRRQALPHDLVGRQALVALAELRDERTVDRERQEAATCSSRRARSASSCACRRR